MDSRYNKYLRLAENTYFKRLGKVVKIVGLTIESVGPDAKLNDLCRIIIDENANTVVMAEVVGFRDKRLLLMPYESVEGIGVGCIVENTGHPLSVSVGNELLGHTLDGIGRPTDIDKLETPYEYPVDAQPPDPMSRKIISEVLPLGVKAVDGLITVGKGQRIGIFAGSGVGKSTLLGMFARNTKADINVIALIGERGREVREFVERDLGEDCIGNGSNELIASQRTAAAGIGNQVIVGGCSIGATIHLEVCLSATGRVIVGSTIRKTAYLRIAVICKSMMQVFKCQTILYNMCCWNRRTTQLETVSVTVVVTTSVFCPTISECHTILQRYNTSWACFCFSK